MTKQATQHSRGGGGVAGGSRGGRKGGATRGGAGPSNAAQANSQVDPANNEPAVEEEMHVDNEDIADPGLQEEAVYPNGQLSGK